MHTWSYVVHGQQIIWASHISSLNTVSCVQEKYPFPTCKVRFVCLFLPFLTIDRLTNWTNGPNGKTLPLLVKSCRKRRKFLYICRMNERFSKYADNIRGLKVWKHPFPQFVSKLNNLLHHCSLLNNICVFDRATALLCKKAHHLLQNLTGVPACSWFHMLK